MTRTASIGIRVKPELKAQIEAAAKADGRTMAQWIERLIVRELQAMTTDGDK
ncbi:YlcI/YnfO family protein [Rhodovarius lipocyclicus]|uniref:YlcI/YnfO family protein n=1 Tax=Rhodovarius lipocyclicus TaxID=268410 RepID=UPI0038B5A518